MTEAGVERYADHRADALRAVVMSLTESVADLETRYVADLRELARVADELSRRAGALIVERDLLRAELAERLFVEDPSDALRDQAERARSDAAASQTAAEAAGRGTSGGEDEVERAERDEDLKTLYRQVAREIHPDLASSDEDRAVRTELMAQANAAFAASDAETLRRLLGGGRAGGSSIAAESVELARLELQVTGLRERQALLIGELDDLQRSALALLARRLASTGRSENEVWDEVAADLRGEIDALRARIASL